jgi:hypothetical protein
LAAFHSGDEQAGITTSCVASEFLQQIPSEQASSVRGYYMDGKPQRLG